jgi:hypothetical protein
MLIEDVEEAITLLSQVPLPEGTFFTMNHLAALSLKARIAQWTNDPNTLQYAEEAITHIDEVARIQWVTGTGATTGNRVFPTELLFCLDVFKLRIYMTNAYTTHISGTQNLNILTNTSDFVDVDIFGLGQHPFGISSADYRYLYWYDYFTTSDIMWQNGRLSVKLRQPEVIAYNIVPLIRMSEPYLIAAESLIGVDNGTVVELINFLRDKRGNPPSSHVPQEISEDALRYIVQQEYRREFSQEGQLFFYYKRRGVERISGAPSVVGEMTNARYTLPYPVAEQEFGRIY